MALIQSLKDLAHMRSQLGTVVLIGGVFDILHGGHINHLEEAKSLGDTLVVHVTSDKRVREKKGPQRPINSQAERAKIIAAIKYVDHVFIGDVPHYYQSVLEALKPDIVMLNYEAATATVREYLASINPQAKIVISDSPKTTSTSGLLAKIQSLPSQ